MKTKKALLLIDLQNDYFEGGLNVLSGSNEAVLEASKLLTYFRRTNQPVIHVQHISTRNDATFFLPGTSGAEIHKMVAPLNDEPIVIKHSPNNFNKTQLDTLLKSMNITDLVVSGMMTHMCVDTTVRAAKNLGYGCVVVSDACATKDLVFKNVRIKAKDVHYAYMAALNPYFAKICTADEVIDAG